jgi:hypothetical protein
MKWMTALIVGLIVGTVLPTAMNGGEGKWIDSWAGWGTVHPHAGSPGLLLSIPLFIGTAVALRVLLNMHSR